MTTSQDPSGETGAAGGAGDPQAGQLMRRAAMASVVAASALIAAKLFAWVMTGSVAMLSTLVDSVLDAMASLINLVAVRHSLQPADREHRFGHGKAESIAGLGQGAFVLGSAVFLVFEAGPRLFRPEPLRQGGLGIGVMVFAIVVTLVLVLYQRHVVRRTQSVAISADSLHYQTDLLVNLGVVVAIVLSITLGWSFADPVIAILIAGFVGHSAWKILRVAYDELMDREFPDEQRKRIKELALSHAGVLDLHDLRTRTSGRDAFIQMHLELDGDLTLTAAHRIADEVERRVQDAFPEAEVIIHQDPAGIDEPRRVFH